MGTQVFIFMFGGILNLFIYLLKINSSKTQVNAVKRMSKLDVAINLNEILCLPEVSVRWARMRSGSCLQYDQLKKLE